MIFKTYRKKRNVIFIFLIIIAFIPIFITAYKLITTERNSVVFLENYPASISTIFLLFYLFLIIYGIARFTKQIILLFKLKNEKKQTELLHLKSQVNPHFFFNTLNNLYGLVGTDVKKAQNLILKLSDMMRYSIYEGEKDFVTLKDEVDYIKNYIELHKMRYHKEINVNFQVQIEEEYKVMPLLFVILLENAFKHGLENLHEGAYIHLAIKTQNNKAFFEIENNFDVSQTKEHDGIGLKNLKRRLELVYPNKHRLTLITKHNIYKAQLTLQL